MSVTEVTSCPRHPPGGPPPATSVHPPALEPTVPAYPPPIPPTHPLAHLGFDPGWAAAVAAALPRRTVVVWGAGRKDARPQPLAPNVRVAPVLVARPRAAQLVPL